MSVSKPAWRRNVSLCRLFVSQDLRSRFDGSLLGIAWTVISPLLQLAVFYVVFLHIFKARVPGLAPDAYLVFLALGFWPWFAFSEAVTRATTAIQDQAALAGKVALPRVLLVISRVLASFVLHGLGFIVVLLIVAAIGPALHWSLLPWVLFLWLPLLAMAIGAGMLVAAVQVFVRDLSQSIGPVMSFWFFLTPIIYALQMTPEALRNALLWNPLTAVVQGQRGLLFGEIDLTGWPSLLVGSMLLPLLGLWVFRRTEPWFEDYL